MGGRKWLYLYIVKIENFQPILPPSLTIILHVYDRLPHREFSNYYAKIDLIVTSLISMNSLKGKMPNMDRG